MNKSSDIAKLCNENQEIMEISILNKIQKKHLKSANNFNRKIIISHQKITTIDHHPVPTSWWFTQ